MALLLYGFLWLWVAVLPILTQQLPDTQELTISELEANMFDFSPVGFFSGVTPCTLYFDSSTGGQLNPSVGRQTSAQWIRVAFRK